MASTPPLESMCFYIVYAAALLLAVKKSPNISGYRRSNTSMLMPNLVSACFMEKSIIAGHASSNAYFSMHMYVSE